MQLVRFSLAVLATWLVFVIGGALWHEVIFDRWYDEWVHEIVRLEMPIGFFLLTHAMRALVLVYVYTMLYKGGSPIIKGLKFGFLMGMITGLVVTSYYGDFKISSPSWALMEFAYNIIRGLMAGALISLIIGRRETVAEA